jgi:hypothetical protein
MRTYNNDFDNLHDFQVNHKYKDLFISPSEKSHWSWDVFNTPICDLGHFSDELNLSLTRNDMACFHDIDFCPSTDQPESSNGNISECPILH